MKEAGLELGEDTIYIQAIVVDLVCVCVCVRTLGKLDEEGKLTAQPGCASIRHMYSIEISQLRMEAQ